MKYTLILTLVLTGCGVIPTQQIVGTDGRTYTWIAPFPSTANGEQGVGGRSAQVTTYTGTVNGRGVQVQSFK